MNDSQKKIISICVWLTIVLFSVRCVISWARVINGIALYDVYGYAGEAVSAGVVLTGLYEKYLWRINPFESTPKLAKKYRGYFKSSYDQKERKAILEIHQTLLSVQVTLISGESKSNSIAASINEIFGEKQLIYCYLNTPKSEYRYRSEIHYGTANLTISSFRELKGHYYTDRKTVGDMYFKAD